MQEQYFPEATPTRSIADPSHPKHLNSAPFNKNNTLPSVSASKPYAYCGPMTESANEKVFAFGESDFLVEEFNPEQFLAKYAMSCDLDDLKKDLAEFVSHCKHAIMNIMNTDYESFVSLAMRLKGLKEKLHAIRSPLEDSEEQLRNHKDALLRECESLVELLKKHQELEEKKRHLSRFLSINSILSQSESLLQEVAHFLRTDL